MGNMYHIFVAAFVPDRLSVMYRTIYLDEKCRNCRSRSILQRGSKFEISDSRKLDEVARRLQKLFGI